MPPPVYKPQAAPEYNQGVSTEASGSNYSNYFFFKPEYNDKVDFQTVPYSRESPKVTVFRPFPCRSFADPNNSFEPYRLDPGGRNYWGWWLLRVPVAWKVGRPTTSFLVHNPLSGVPFDARLTPLSSLYRAVSFAIKKGQGKAEEWSQSFRRSFEPDAQTLLEWDGMKEGENKKGAILTSITEVFLMQGIMMLKGGEPPAPGKAPIGWGENPTCVLGLTKGAGERMIGHLGAERENYRGHPADFESRYVDGDPVGVDNGRFLYVYPKGADPRQAQYTSQPANYNPLDATTSARASHGKDKKREDIGFDCHFEKTFQGIPAVLNKPAHRAAVRDKWIHWSDMLHFPNFVEQAQILSRVMPPAMLLYAFGGEHDEWLSPEIRAKAVAQRSASVPAAPPTTYSPPPGGFGADPAAAFGTVPTPPAPMNEAVPMNPFDMTGVPDQALPTPPDTMPTAPTAPLPSSPLDEAFGNLADRATAVFSGSDSADAAGIPVPPPIASGGGQAFGFDPPPPPPAAPTSAAAIAAAKARMNA